VQGGRAIAGWLLARRGAIEAALAERLGAGPAPGGAAEAAALRRLRSYLLLALTQGEAAPSLEGLRTGERSARRLIEAWLEAAASVAGPDQAALRAALGPLVERFLLSLRETARARRAGGAPVSGQRLAVAAAIDRVSDAFLAIDAETGAIADANPAAGALLGTTRDRLLGADAMTFVPSEARDAWWAQLDAVSEGTEPRRVRASLQGPGGRAHSVDATRNPISTPTPTHAKPYTTRDNP
jgi:PAS domain S-box-containing protein